MILSRYEKNQENDQIWLEQLPFSPRSNRNKSNNQYNLMFLQIFSLDYQNSYFPIIDLLHTSGHRHFLNRKVDDLDWALSPFTIDIILRANWIYSPDYPRQIMAVEVRAFELWNKTPCAIPFDRQVFKYHFGEFIEPWIQLRVLIKQVSLVQIKHCFA